MKIEVIRKIATALVGFALFNAPSLQAATNVVYFDPFTATPGSPLANSSPQQHGGVGVDLWSAPDAGIELDGATLTVTAGSKWAALPFSPLEGNKYRLSMDMSPTHGNSDWFAVGFSELTDPNGSYEAQHISGWLLNRGTNADNPPLHSFTGYATDGGGALGKFTGPHNIAVVLDTTVANWTFEFFVDGVSQRGPVPFSTTPDVNPYINYVTFGSYGGARGVMDNFKLEIIYHVDMTIPTVVEQPKDVKVLTGGTAKFSAVAAGARPLSYQWYKNDTIELTGEISSVLTLLNLTPADSGSKYSVKVSNGYGDRMSSNAVLTVLNVTGPLIHKFSFNDGTANDSVGGINGALHGTASISGGELILDGSDAGFASLGDYVMPPSGSATVVAWFKAAPSVGAWSRVFDFGSSTLSYMFFSPMGGNVARFGIKIGADAEASISRTPALNDSLNHVIAAVVDSTPTETGVNGTMYLYIDGVPVGTNDLNGTVTLSGLESGPQNYFGKSQWINTGDAFFKGAIDEVRVYNTALLQSEITALASDANPATKPSVFENPKDSYTFIGGSASFGVTALGSAPLFYQWRLNGSPVSGANSTTLNLSNVLATNFGDYDVVITNSSGSITSSVARLLETRWTYASWTDDATSGVDTNFYYTHAYSFGSANNTEINGQTFIGVGGGIPTVAGSFAVTGSGSVFNGDANNVTGGSQVMATDFIYGGNPGTLTLNGLAPGKDYVLTLFSVAWEAPGARPIRFSVDSGEQLVVDQDTYDNNNGIRISYQYTADANGSVKITSTPIVAGNTLHFYGFCNRLLKTIASNAKPEILVAPAPAAAALDGTTRFSVTAGGPGPFSYQWLFNGAPISGAASDSYTIDAVKTSSFGDYSVVVGNTYGSVTSAVAQLVLLRWSYTNWTDDATSGVDTNYVYTHAYNFGKIVNTTINGLLFKGVTGGDPAVANVFTVSGVPNVFNNDVNNMTGGSLVMATDFIYGGNPGSFTLYGLTPNKKYLLTFYSVGFDAIGGRPILFSAADHQQTVIDQDAYDLDNGIRISYEYTADSTGSVTVTTAGTLSNSSLHTYGFSNRELQLPEIKLQVESVSNSSVTLAWPGSALDYTLKSTSALGAAASWQAVSGNAVLSGGVYRITVPINGTQFFRLQK